VPDKLVGALADPSGTIEELVRTRRVIITVGAGGVGKTTTAAAVALLGVTLGRRVLCLTIDPAKRLAQSLGLEAMSGEARVVERARFDKAGIEAKGTLTAMMLDTKRTFDELVRRLAPTPERAERVLANKLYRYMSTSLAGTDEYMAMEKLLFVKSDPSYDLIVLDTPPTANALDFLDAPERMIAALDSAAVRWFVEAFEATGKFSLNILARSAAVVLRTIGRITGGAFLEDVATLLGEMNELFGGFRERATRVRDEMRASDVAFLLVASPAPTSLREAMFFEEKLREANMPCGAFIVNRFHEAPPVAPSDEELRSSIQTVSGLDAPDLAMRIRRAHEEALRWAEEDRIHVEAVAQGMKHLPVVRVPALAEDVHDLVLLNRVSTILARA